MKREHLEILNDMPFLFWIKDKDGKYLWGNRAICRLAGEEIAGKTDDDLVWAKDAKQLQTTDKQVLESNEPVYLHEYVDKSSQGGATLNVCKWADDFEGKKCSYGISFTIG